MIGLVQRIEHVPPVLVPKLPLLPRLPVYCIVYLAADVWI